MISTRLPEPANEPLLPKTKGKLSLLNSDFLNQLENKYSGNLISRVLNSVLDIYPNNFNIKAISEKLNISLTECFKSFDDLEQLGIIRKTDSGFKKVLRYIYYPNRPSNSQRSIEDHVLISSQLLNRLSSVSEFKNFYRTSFVATNSKLAGKFAYDLDKLLKDFLSDSEKSKKDSVFSLSVTGLETYKDKDLEADNENF